VPFRLSDSIEVFSPPILAFSDLHDLRGLHDGILPRDGLSPGGLVVVGAVVAVAVPVLGAEEVTAPTAESGQPDAPPASRAPVHRALRLRRRRPVRVRSVL